MPNRDSQSAPALGVPILFGYLYWLRDRVTRVAAQLDASSTPSMTSLPSLGRNAAHSALRRRSVM